MAARPAGLAMYRAILSGGDKSALQSEGGDTSVVIDETEDGTAVFNSKFEDVKETWHDGEVFSVTKTQSQYNRTQQNKKRFGEYSLLLRRIHDLDDRKTPKLQLEIQSDTLRRLFRGLAQGIESISLNHKPIIIPEPYAELYYCREQIHRAVGKATTDETRRELQLLVDFETQFMSPTIATITSFQSNGTIDFDCLWSLFPPGCKVVIQNTSATTTAIEWCTVSKSYETVVRNGVHSWILTVTHTGFNGRSFGNVKTVFNFPSFSGIMNINQLPAFPLHYYPQNNQLTNSAIVRGQKYEQYCLKSSKTSKPPIGTTMVYEGPFWTTGSRSSRAGCQMHDSPSNAITGRVVVDVEGFLSNYPVFRETLLPEGNARASENGGNSDSYSDSDGDGDSDSSGPRRIIHRHHLYRSSTTSPLDAFPAQLPMKPLSEEQQLTCPPFIPAFSFSVRQWGFVLVNELEDVIWKPEVFNKLQMNQHVKEKLHSIVAAHSTNLTDFDDFIQGKGRGLVILLHGPPGCGKTMTAETIAESLKKPLYNVNGGELGTSSASIQDGLERAFGLVSRWDAIFLLDEADAFLERRGDSVEKNASILVFLRLLEYQAGTIFLTTNRVTNIDKAFHSRIHIIMPYRKLDSADRAAIWKDLANEKCGCRLTDEEVLKLGKLPVNGRVIKNILRLATLLTKAHSKKATMEFANIIAVLPLAIGNPKSGSLTDELNQTAEERLEGEDLVVVMNCLASEVSS